MTERQRYQAALDDPDARPLAEADLARMKRTPQAKIIRPIPEGKPQDIHPVLVVFPLDLVNEIKIVFFVMLYFSASLMQTVDQPTPV